MMVRRRDEERGSILPMTVLLISAIMTFTAFAVDLGLKRAARSDMQSVADVVALDLARHIEGRTRGVIEGSAEWGKVKDRSVARNGTTVGARPAVTAELGRLDRASGLFSAVGSTEVPTAVRVTAGTSVNFTFVSGTGTTARTAVATVDPGACFSVGGFAAVVGSNNGALDKLLGPIVGVGDLKLLGSGGVVALKDLQIPLLSLATQLGVGTATDLVNVSTTAGGVLLAAATVLSSQGDTAGANLLNAMRARLQLLPAKPVRIGDLLDLSGGGDAALKLNIDALDLVSGSLLVANGSNTLAVPGLGLTIPGLSAISTKATVVEPPKIACGRSGATAKSSQVRLELTADVGGIVSGVSDVKLKLSLEAGSAQGVLRSLRCGTSTGSALDVDVTTALVKNLALHLDLKVAGVLGLPTAVGVDVTSAAVGSGPGRTVTLTYPASGTPLPSTTVSGISTLNLASSTVSVSVLGLPLGPLLSGTVTPLLAALDPLLVSLLTPTLALLGASLGGAEVAAVGGVDCNAPQLSG